jgi:hypothetical protein
MKLNLEIDDKTECVKRCFIKTPVSIICGICKEKIIKDNYYILYPIVGGDVHIIFHCNCGQDIKMPIRITGRYFEVENDFLQIEEER